MYQYEIITIIQIRLHLHFTYQYTNIYPNLSTENVQNIPKYLKKMYQRLTKKCRQKMYKFYINPLNIDWNVQTSTLKLSTEDVQISIPKASTKKWTNFYP